MSIELSLLGFLIEEPAYGYEIYQRLRASNGLWQVWRMKQSQLYALLKGLEAQGLVDSTFAPQPGRPARKMLTLTDTGRQAFLDWVHSPVERGREMRIEFLAKLYFALQMDVAQVDQLIATQRGICQTWQDEMPGSDTLGPMQSDSVAPFDRAVQIFRRTQIDAFIAFLDACEILCRSKKTLQESTGQEQ